VFKRQISFIARDLRWSDGHRSVICCSEYHTAWSKS